jgi:hypothetical protein
MSVFSSTRLTHALIANDRSALIARISGRILLQVVIDDISLNIVFLTIE